jgi:hypothetical protein
MCRIFKLLSSIFNAICTVKKLRIFGILFRDPNLSFVETRAVNGTRACYDKHTHESFSIGTVLNGQAKCWNRRAQVDTGRGSFVIINPEDVHACNLKKDSAWAYRMLFIESAWLAALQREIGLSAQHDLHLFAQTASDDRALYDDLNRFFETLWQPTERLAKESALVAFLMRLHEQFETDVMALKSNHRLSQAAEFIAAYCLDKRVAVNNGSKIPLHTSSTPATKNKPQSRSRQTTTWLVPVDWS